MKLARHWLIQFKRFFRHQLYRRITQIILVSLLICFLVRSLPFLAPIRSADIAQDKQAIAFTDRNGLPLGTLLTLNSEHTAVVPLNQVSSQFIRAIIAAEDGSYYHHGPLDMKAIARAVKDAIHAKRVVSGASTITMQLARMLDASERNLWGKVREVWLSWRLAAGMNKDEILRAYVNRLPMGGNIYGVEAASRIYFSIPASDLNLAQGSLLAAIPNNPTYFNPYQHWKRLKQRQKYVLNRMVQDGYITPAVAERAYAEKVIFESRQKGIIAAPHFLFWLSSQRTLRTPPLTPPRMQGGGLEKTPPRMQKGGLEKTPPHMQGGELKKTPLPLSPEQPRWTSPIRTTINRPLQQFVEAQVQQVIENLKGNNVHDAAALAIDNHTGEVLAYVGSPNYFDEVKLGRNDGVQALRQPGSTLKPFLYELALEKGVIRPNTILLDEPTYYAIPGAKLYSPTDYNKTFLGKVRVRIALANSLNVPAVRVLEKVGVQSFLERLRQLGFEHLTQPAEYYGLGLTLGSGEVSLWELARVYVTMARFGNATPLLTTFSPLPTPRSVLPNPTTWQLIADMLSDRHARATAFGVDSVLALPFPSAVKTGTSSNFRDTWTVGFTTDYTVATWVGNFNGEPMRQVSGVTGAAPLWNRIMLHLHEHQEPGGFLPPKGLVQLPICAISGLKPTPDCSSVVQEYFYPEDIADESKPENKSSVVAKKLRILSPNDGAVFLLYPGEEGKQKLEFKLAGSDGSVEWWLNGEKLGTDASSVFWNLQPGKWTLSARNGEVTDKVSFQVQLARIKSSRRGFSVVSPRRE
ncbi:MAG: transglycosylase domain-containing protein [Cyanomargarita calcarea GSE-NOS-MK-12-04C]|uniref:Transglycosylase domain-containing protein n=1 Tax=Cyanomargarita calcarea GSE-NOS-MK-12-04C TaxID=2839659 RepID=A0A951UW24_9CYAN|nr:transglycosylase domain-containing protein [Cyanomargarita calcarea GSE-NOS-MK-12-04C]